MVAAVTVLVLFLALVAWRKGWHASGLVALCLGVAYAILSQPGVQDALKTYAAAQAQLGRVGQQAASATREVDELTGRLSAQGASLQAHEARLTAQESALTAQQEAWQQISGELQALRQAVDDQRDELARSQALVQDVVGGTTTDELWLKDRERVILVPQDGVESLVYFQLSRVPRPETMKVSWHTTVFPATAYTVQQNIVSVKVTGPTKGLRKRPFRFDYVADTSRADERTTVSLRDDVVYAGDTPLGE